MMHRAHGTGRWSRGWLLAGLGILVLLGADRAQAQSADSPLVFGGRFVDVLGRNLYDLSGGGNSVQLGFTLLRTGQRVNVYIHPGWGDNQLLSDGSAFVTFAAGATVGDAVRCSLSVDGSAPTTLVHPLEVVLTAQDIAAARAERSFLVGGPPGARSFRFRARIADTAGRNLYELTAGGNNVSTQITNARNGLSRNVYYHPGWGDNALASDGTVFVDFSESGNQAARAGDTFVVAMSVSGSAVSTLAHPRSFVVTDGDIRAGVSPVHQVTFRGPLAARTGRLNLRLADEAGRSLYALTDGGNQANVTVTNLRSGQVVSPYFHPGWGDNQLAEDGGTFVTFSENGNQAIRDGDVLAVSLTMDGSTRSRLSHPPTFVVTEGDVAAGSTPVHKVTLGGPLSTRRLRFRVRLSDTAGRNLYDLTAGGNQASVTVTNLRNGLVRTPYFHPGWGDNQLAENGGTYVDFSENGNQAVSEGDILTLAVSLSGSLPSTSAEPSSFVVTRGDIVAQETPVHEAVVGGLPSTRQLRVRARLSDALGRNLYAVTEGGNDAVVRFTNLRTGVAMTPYLHPGWGDNQLAADGSTYADFTESGNQAIVVGDRIQVAVTPGAGQPTLASDPPTIVITAGDVQARQTPVRELRLGGRPLARGLRARARFVYPGGQNLYDATSGGSGVAITFQNRRTGRTVSPYIHPGWGDNQLAADGSTQVDFSGDGNFTAAVGDEIEAWVTLSSVRQQSDPATFVVTSGDLAGGLTPAHPITLTVTATPRKLTLSGRVRDSLGREVDGAGVTALVSSSLPGMNGLSASARTPSTWSGSGDYELVLASTGTLATTSGTAITLWVTHPILGSLQASVPLTAGGVAAGRVVRDFVFGSTRARHFTLSGAVKDSHGRPLDGASVRASLVASGVAGTTLDVRAVTPGTSGRPGSYLVTLVGEGTLAVVPGSIVRIEASDSEAGTMAVTAAADAGSVTAGGLSRDLGLPASRLRRFVLEGEVADRLGRAADRVRVRAAHLRLGRSVESTTPSTAGTGTFRLVWPEPVARAIRVGDRLRLEAFGSGSGLAGSAEVTIGQQHLLADRTGLLRGLRLALESVPAAGALVVRGTLRNGRGAGLTAASFTLTNARTGERVVARTPATATAGSYEAVLGWPEDSAVRAGDVLAISDVSWMGVSRTPQPASIAVGNEQVRTGLCVQDLVAELPVRAPLFEVRGRVLDLAGAPVDRATLTLLNPRTGVNRTCLTPSGSDYGSFLFPFQDDTVGVSVESDLWTLSVAPLGLATQTFRLAFSEAEMAAGSATRDLSLAGAAPGQPALASIAPASGVRTGPTPVTLTGNGFTGAYGARLEGVEISPLTSFSVVSDGQATAFVPPGLAPGQYRVVMFGPGGASPDGPLFTVVDPFAGPPVASIRLFGRDRGGSQIVRLDGSASTGEALSYAWSLLSAPAGSAFLEESSAIAYYAARLPGEYRFGLRVADARGRAGSAEAGFTVTGTPPVARIDTRPEVVLRVPASGLSSEDTTDTLHLDGSGSFEPAFDSPLSFQWTLVDFPAGSGVPARLAGLSLTGPLLAVGLGTESDGSRRLDAGRYLFRLSVSGVGGSASALAEISVLDPLALGPRADAGVSQTARVRVVDGPRLAPTIPDPTLPPGPDGRGNLRPYLRLDGHESSDPRGRPLTYQWRVVDVPFGRPLPALSDPASPIPTFTANHPGEYVFGLTVNNGVYASQEDLVSVRLQVEQANTPPNAEAVARCVGREGQPRARADLVELDGTLSSDRDDPPPLAYAWSQFGGRPVELVESSPGRMRFVPPEAGAYRFALTVTDTRGAVSEPFELAVDAAPGEGAPPAVRLVSSVASRAETGEDFTETELLAQPRTLRVNTLERVTLSAFVNDPAGLAQGRTMRVRWRQADGPRVVLQAAQGLPGAASAVAFEPTTSRVHLFAAQALQFDAAGSPTGVEVERRVRVVVDSPLTRVPEAVFDVLHGGRVRAKFDARSKVTILPSVRPRTVVVLDGSDSRDLNVPPRWLFYRWEQTAGPRVVLSNPSSAVATFVVPLLTDRNPHRYVFQLFVDNGEDRSEPVAGAVDALPDGAVALEPGLNLIGLAYDPATSGQVYRSEDLLRETGASFVARVVPGGRFEVQLSNLAGASFEMDGAHGYLLRWPTWLPASTLVPEGPEWPAARRLQVLTPGLNLLSCPPMLPETADAELLRARTAATFVAQFEPGGKVVPYLPGLTPPFLLEGGRGYVLVVPAGVTPTFPTR